MHLPTSFIQSLQNAPGFDENEFIQTHQSGQQITSIRINPSKFDIQHSTFGIDEQVPWNSHGYYLKERPSFTLDPLFHAGAYYVQEASSMFLQEAIKQSCDLNKPKRVLDLCAAPGGKSTLIQSIICENSLLVCNELIKTRANILAENITKWGAANVVVTNNDAKDFQRLPSFFDLIVVDAPCSGSGLFRKDPEAIKEWSLNNVQLCSQRQQRILADVMIALKPGGILIYSTCSYSTEEDETISDWMLENYDLTSEKLKIKNDWNIIETISPVSNAYGYRFYPDKVRGEGFFIAVFKKTAASLPSREIKLKTKSANLTKPELEIAHTCIQHPDKFTFIKWQEEVLVIPAAIYEPFLQLQAALYIKKAGVKLGSIIRNEMVPHHDWALSTIKNNTLQSVELGEQTALDYLRRKGIEINTDTKGWALVTYKKLSLGLVKILPNRINNYYPRDWRILNR